VPVHRISRFGFVNAFLVEEDDGLTLIDTAIPRSAGAITKAADALGKPIRRIALTHAHGDHIGSLDALVEMLPGVEVIIGARDERLLRKDKSADPGEPADAKVRGGLPGSDVPVARTVSGGDRVGSLEVVEAPGHTPGHVAYLDTRDQTLYCGDAYATRGDVRTTAKSSWKFPFLQTATWHKPTAIESARKLRALDPARLAPGHGNVVEHPGAAMDAAITLGF
jgi:glyoxylase-like metal-dependent hydrolase (beta-lactamase superfamily II)